MALLYKREPIFKITLQKSHFDSLFFSVEYPKFCDPPQEVPKILLSPQRIS